ncbi:hypothetical protein Dimus_026508, partial [Dionaea muscipula]
NQKEALKRSMKGKKEKKRRKMKELKETMRKEPRTKRKHDMDASKSSEVLLNEWLEKAKQGEDYVAKETSPKGVDPSVKRQNVKRRSVKKVKQPKALASSYSSESEGTRETRRRNKMVTDTEEDSTTKEGTESKEKSTTTGTKGEYSYSEDTYFDADDDDGNVEIDHDNIIEVENTQQGSSQKKSGQSTNVGGINPLSITTDFRLLHLQEQLQTTHARDCSTPGASQAIRTEPSSPSN